MGYTVRIVGASHLEHVGLTREDRAECYSKHESLIGVGFDRIAYYDGTCDRKGLYTAESKTDQFQYAGSWGIGTWEHFTQHVRALFLRVGSRNPPSLLQSRVIFYSEDCQEWVEDFKLINAYLEHHPEEKLDGRYMEWLALLEKLITLGSQNGIVFLEVE